MHTVPHKLCLQGQVALLDIICIQAGSFHLVLILDQKDVPVASHASHHESPVCSRRVIGCRAHLHSKALPQEILRLLLPAIQNQKVAVFGHTESGVPGSP